MAGLRESDHSALADALVLSALFLPYFPIVATVYSAAATTLFGCSPDLAQACHLFAINLNAAHGNAAELLRWSSKAAGSDALLVYICILTLLAQFTTHGFRGRVVRTCAVIMLAGVMPLILGFADVIAGSSGHLCGGAPCSLETILPTFAYLGRVFFNWLTNIAVPLGVMVSLLVALTMGYRILVGRIIGFVMRRN